MSELVHADIFFFVTTFAVVLIALFFLVVLWYFIGIVRNIKRISDRFHAMSGDLQQDFDALRATVKSKSGEFAMKTATDLFQRFWQRKATKPPGRKKPAQP